MKGINRIILLVSISSCSLGSSEVSETKTELTKQVTQAETNSHLDTVWVEALGSYHPNVALLRHYFNEAANEFNVPVGLLMAVGAVESNWTQSGQPSIDQGWGIMHLSNGTCKSLNAAADLLGISEEQLKKSAKLNIRGGAAVLDLQASRFEINRLDIKEWQAPLAVFSCLINEELSQTQAKEYIRMYNQGIQASTIWGDSILINSKTP